MQGLEAKALFLGSARAMHQLLSYYFIAILFPLSSTAETISLIYIDSPSERQHQPRPDHTDKSLQPGFWLQAFVVSECVVYIQSIFPLTSGAQYVTTVYAEYTQYDKGVSQMEIIISNAGDTPIYEQITRQFKGLILQGKLQAGEALPSMRLLAKELRISVITTKRAYEELERDGFITTVPGKGCFVAPRNLELAREDTLRRAEEHLAEAVHIAKLGGVTLEELGQTLHILYGEELV